MNKVIGYFDMDGPMADFELGIGRDASHPDRGIYTGNKDILKPMYEKGFFRNLPVTDGAKEAIAQLMKIDRIEWHVATKPMVDGVFYSATEKFEWLDEHFPELVKNTFLTCNKGHLNGHYLIDDHREAWEPVFNGSFLFFDVRNPKQSWKNIVNYLQKYDPNNLPNQVIETPKYPALVRTSLMQNHMGPSRTKQVQIQIRVGDAYVKIATFKVSDDGCFLVHSREDLGSEHGRHFDDIMRIAKKGSSEWSPIIYEGDLDKIELRSNMMGLAHVELPFHVNDNHVGNPQ